MTPMWGNENTIEKSTSEQTILGQKKKAWLTWALAPDRGRHRCQGAGSWSPPTAQGELHPSWGPGSPMARPGTGSPVINLFQTASNAL